MGKRIVSGAGVTVLAVAAILAGGIYLAGALLIISLIAYRELCRAGGVHAGKGSDALETAGYAGIAVYYLLIWLDGSGRLTAGHEKTMFYLFMLLIGELMLMLTIYVLTFPRYRSEQVMTAFFCILYGPGMLSFIYLTETMRYGLYIVWMIFISSWICDTCAYFTGVAFGRHRLAPVLSPKKSVEGAIGGVAGSALAGMLFSFLVAERAIPDQSVTWAFAALGGIGAVISQIGDLAASAIKRNHDIKDYGTCIPGHGGIMDRFDSVIFTAPVIYFMAKILIGA